MAKKEKSNLPFRKKLLLLGVAFLFFVLMIASFFGRRGLIEIFRGYKEKASLLQEIEQFEKKKVRLEREIIELEGNPEAVEKKAREKLWMVKPEEIIIIKK